MVNERLKEISKCTPYPYKNIKRIFDIVKSYDDTIKVILMAVWTGKSNLDEIIDWLILEKKIGLF